MTPEVSILMPCRNAAFWIAETIASIQKQSLTNWELICIDDFSTDGSYHLIEQLAQTDRRIMPVKNQMKGIISALQLGLSLSSGIYITRMDADDKMTPNRLKLKIDVIKTLAPKSIVTGKVEYFSSESVSIGYKKYEEWINERVHLNDHYKHIYRECVVASPNWLGRKKDLIDAEIFDHLSYPEDYDMVFRWKKNNFSIISVPDVTLLWREHPQRTSRNSSIYDQNSFFQLKLNWFLALENMQNRSVGILGVNQKGKLITSFFDSKNISFNWYDLQIDKFNTPINGVSICSVNAINDDILLVSIFPNDRKELEQFLSLKGYVFGGNAWYF